MGFDGMISWNKSEKELHCGVLLKFLWEGHVDDALKYLKSLTPDALQAPDHGDVADVPVHPDGKVHIQTVQGGPGQHLPVRRLLHQLTDGPALAQPAQPNVLG